MKKQSTKPVTSKTALHNDDTDSAVNNISSLEKKLLDTSGEDDEEHYLHVAELDNTDDDGELLNENESGDIRSGGELDVPGSEDDDDEEELGEEDEENNSYSLGGEKKD